MKGKGFIVIQEEDDLIRELLERWLGEAGYAVALAALGRPWSSWRHEVRFAVSLVLPVVVACGLARLLAG